MRFAAFLAMSLGAVALTACREQETNAGPGSKDVTGNSASSPVSGTTATEELWQRVEKGLRLPVLFAGEGLQTMTVEEALDRTRVPGLSIAVINDGTLTKHRRH